jgi:hypothetical protein
VKATDPADIPDEQPTKFDQVNNLKTVEALGIRFPPIFLTAADEK